MGTQALLFSPKQAPGFQQPSCSLLQTQEVQLGAGLLTKERAREGSPEETELPGPLGW